MAIKTPHHVQIPRDSIDCFFFFFHNLLSFSLKFFNTLLSIRVKDFSNTQALFRIGADLDVNSSLEIGKV